MSMIERVFMDRRKIVYKETTIIAAGELILSGIMVGIFAALGCFRMNVLWGAILGCSVMIANFFFMAVTVSLATDRARQGNVEQAQKVIQLSSVARLLVMGVALMAGIRLGANVLALLLPLLFARPVLMLSAFFQKEGEK